MDDLIAALTILRKYGNPQWPTHCEHDILYVAIPHEDVTAEDKVALDKLGFRPSDEGPGFYSFKFGSC